MNNLIRVVLACLSVLLVAGCATRGATVIAEPERTYKQQSYVIGISDQLSVDVWRNQDLSRSVMVRPDGFITMPLMGDVRAESRSPEDLADVISVGLQKVIKNPEVTVTVTNPNSIAYQYRVRAMGQVNQPTSISFVEGMTVMDLVLAAGGVSDFGAGNRALLNRVSDSGTREYPVYLNDILNEGDIRTNYLLQPADILTIPEKKFWRGEF